MPNLSIIIPACNESARLKHTVETYLEFLERSAERDFEIIVVCNGCEDNTAEIALSLSERTNLVKVLNIPEKIGKGGAVKAGLARATGLVCLFADADGSTSPNECQKLVLAVRDNCDVAIGSRHMSGSRVVVRQPLARRLAGRGFNILVRVLFGFPFRDTQCGAKALAKETLPIVLSSVKTNGFSFDVDLLWRLKQNGFRIREIPVVWRDSGGSTLRIRSHMPRMLAEVIRLRFGAG